MDRYRKEVIQVRTKKNDIKVQYLYDNQIVCHVSLDKYRPPDDTKKFEKEQAKIYIFWKRRTKIFYSFQMLKLGLDFCLRYPGDEESYGILEEDFFTVRHDWKLQQLQEIMPILSI